MLEGSFQTLEPVVSWLRGRPGNKAGGVSQHGGHQINPDRLTGDRDDLFTEVDLDLLARRGLEPDSGQAPWPVPPDAGSRTARCRVRKSIWIPRVANSC